jgi:hypothetical protein
MSDLAKALMEIAPDRVVLLDGGARRCRVCGCTQDHACVDPDHGPCWWIEADLCSHCGEPAIVAAAYDRLLARLVPGEAAFEHQLKAWTARARVALGRVTTTDASAFEL